MGATCPPCAVAPIGRSYTIASTVDRRVFIYPPRVSVKGIVGLMFGACEPNPGPGGWGVLLLYNGQEMRIYG